MKKNIKYIESSKTNFFGFIFNRINQGLKKRNLEPIFTPKKSIGKKQKSQSIINLKTERINNTAEDNKHNLANTSIGFNTHGFGDKINGENNNNFGLGDNAEDEKEININDLLIDDNKEDEKK